MNLPRCDHAGKAAASTTKMPAPLLTTPFGIRVRPVLVPLKRPIVSKVGAFDHWPLILIDLHTREGIVGRAYLEP